MLDRLIGTYLAEHNLINQDQLTKIYEEQESKRAKLGVIAVTEKMMSIAQAEQVNALQASMDKRFGDIAVEKGYLTEPQVGRLLELQGNVYLTFLQSAVDLGFLTMDKLEDAEKQFQAEHGYTETDMAILKSGDVEKIVPIFLETDSPQYKEMFSMGVKNMYRLVDNHIFIGKAYKTTSVNEEVLGYQQFHGDQSAFVGIAGKYEDVQKMAKAYTMEDFIETKEDALDAVCELINCINGLYATAQSQNEIKIELDPPNFAVTFREVKSDEIIVLPVYICGGQIKYLLTVSCARTEI